MMKKFLLLLPLLLVGCGSLRKSVVVTHTTHDTLYINTLKHDSVFIYQESETDRINDTVVIREILREFKYQFLRDTIHSVRIDSIPVVKTVEITKNVKAVPAIYKWSLGICIVLSILLILYIVWKIRF